MSAKWRLLLKYPNMIEEKFCDFCGRLEHELPAPADTKKSKLTIDEDGLWACVDCGSRLRTEPVGDGGEVELEEELVALVGKRAGKICRELGLPFAPPYEFVLDAASRIGSADEQPMSDWVFVNQWLDGSTVWRAEDGRGMAIVKPDGSIQVNADWFAD